MTATPLVLRILKVEEKCRLQVYQDSEGYPTIGWGHKLTDDEDYPEGITQLAADALLLEDASHASSATLAAFPWIAASGPAQLDFARQAVLVCMAYQLGIYGLRGFSTMLAAVKAHQWQAAHDAAIKSLWARQTPSRAKRMADILLTGDASYYDNQNGGDDA